MKTKLLSAALALIFCCGLLAGCGGEEKKKVNITVKVPTLRMAPKNDSSVKDSYGFLVKAAESFQKQYKDADVKVKVTMFEATEQVAEIDKAFGTPEAADVFYADFFNSTTYVYTGRAVPLDDIITPAMRHDIDERFFERYSQRGKTYLMPFLYRQNVMGYNKDLFRQCGLEQYISDENEVQNWSLAEWEYILATLKQRLPGNIYPMMLYAGNNQGDTHIMALLRSQGSTFFDKDGYFALETPEGVAGLKWLKSLNDRGYCPPSPQSLVISDCGQLFKNGQLAMYFVNDARGDMYNFPVGYVNFPSTGEKGISTNYYTGFAVFDNGDAQKLAAAKAFVKYIYESDFIDYSSGSIPCSKKVIEKYAKELTGLQRYINNADTAVRITADNPNWVEVREAFYPQIKKLLTGESTPEEAAKLLDENCNAAIKRGYEESSLHK